MSTEELMMIGGLILCALTLVLAIWSVRKDNEEAVSELDKERLNKYGHKNEWHYKHFDYARQFQKWMNDPKNKPIYKSCYSGEEFVVFPLGEDGFDVVYRD